MSLLNTSCNCRCCIGTTCTIVQGDVQQLATTACTIKLIEMIVHTFQQFKWKEESSKQKNIHNCLLQKVVQSIGLTNLQRPSTAAAEDWRARQRSAVCSAYAYQDPDQHCKA